MKKSFPFIVFLFLSSTLFSQNERKGWYGDLSAGYGSYTLDLYKYASGNDIYADQKMTGFALSLGIEKKNVWQKNDFVFDIGGGLNVGLGMKNKINNTETIKNGWALDLNALFKAGYVLPSTSSKIIPLIGLGPYFISIQNSENGDGISNKIYGVQTFAGVDFLINSKITFTPNVRFGIASWDWGTSDNIDDLTQNGQPSLFEIALKLSIKF